MCRSFLLRPGGAYDKDQPVLVQGIDGVQKALKVLRDYYSKPAGDHDTASGGGATIIGLLEVCESDFEKGLS